MKRAILDLLCCPACKGALTLQVEREDQGEIMVGSLICSRCKIQYPIREGIPDLLPRESSSS